MYDMNDQDKTKDQLIAELVGLRRQVAEQDEHLARSRRAEADQQQINGLHRQMVAQLTPQPQRHWWL